MQINKYVMAKISESELIDRYFRKLASNSLEDDCARIQTREGFELVVSKDILCEDVHFNFSDGAKNIADKVILSNLSDIAACGGNPLYYELGIAIDDRIDDEFLEEFCCELKKVQNLYKFSLIGGDSVRSEKGLFFSVTIFGEIEKGKYLDRKNAENNDLIYVSNFIGDSHIGLKMKNGEISDKNRNYFIKKHFSPSPQINLGLELVKNGLSRCGCDISDGLLRDLNNICLASNLSANIFLKDIPISDEARTLINENKVNSLDLLSGGEDYELIFTVKKDDEEKILNLAKKLDIELNKIGYFCDSDDPKIRLFDSNNKEILIKDYGYEH